MGSNGKLLCDIYDMIDSTDLSDREKLIIRGRQEIDECDNNIYFYADLSRILNISCEKVKKIEILATAKLRKRLLKRVAELTQK